MTLTEIRAALETRGLRPLKQLGQNFLHDQNLARWLVARATEGIADGETIVEIGPGLGALTGFFLERGLRVIALEKDRGLSVWLREQFAAQIAAGTFELREGDALEELPRLASGPRLICGNLPYYISTPLLMECLQRPGALARLFFVVQKEVGQRLASPPGGKIYGALSVLVQALGTAALVKTLPGTVFYPQPEVASVAVEFIPHRAPLIAPEESARFTAFVQKGFSQRRKKLSNLLPTTDERRAEHLSPLDWVTLWRACGAP